MNDSTSNDENRTFIDFIWKNIAKKKVISKLEGVLKSWIVLTQSTPLRSNAYGNVFKIPTPYFFIVNHILKTWRFFLMCIFSWRLTLKLSKFHQQALLLSLDIIVRTTLHLTRLFFGTIVTYLPETNHCFFPPKCFQRDTKYVFNHFVDFVNMLSCQQLRAQHNFPTLFKNHIII